MLRVISTAPTLHHTTISSTRSSTCCNMDGTRTQQTDNMHRDIVATCRSAAAHGKQCTVLAEPPKRRAAMYYQHANEGTDK